MYKIDPYKITNRQKIAGVVKYHPSAFITHANINFTADELRIERQVNVINGGPLISALKTKDSIRTVILPQSLLKILLDYKKKADSELMFPSPLDNTKTRNPSAVRKRLQLILERAGCPKIKFHDLRHTFATMALENGMNVKTLSATIGHVSFEITINIYSHITNTIQQQAAAKIDRKIVGSDAEIPQADRRVRIEPTKPISSRTSQRCENPALAGNDDKRSPLRGKIRAYKRLRQTGKS